MIKQVDIEFNCYQFAAFRFAVDGKKATKSTKKFHNMHPNNEKLLYLCYNLAVCSKISDHTL